MIKNNDDWFYNSIPMSEHPPNTSRYDSGLPNNPLDSMPVATNMYHPDGEPPDWEDTAPSEYEPPMQESDWFIEKPDESDEIEEEKTMHQKMYEIATARYNPFSIGGYENCDSDISCEVQKHSPWPGGSEIFQGGSENASRS